MDTVNETNCSELEFTNQSCFNFNNKQFESVFWVKTVLETAAGVVCFTVILLIWFLKAYKRSVHRFALYLTIAALLNSVALILESLPVKNTCDHVIVTNEKLCIAAGFLDEYSSCVILLLICWLTIHMFVLAVFKCNHKSRKLEVGGVIISLTIPIAISTIPFNDFENGIMYGLSGELCWIKTTDDKCNKIEEGVIEQFTLWYGPALFLATVNFLAILVVVIVLYKGTKQEELQNQYKKALKETLPLLIYPIIFLIL